MLWMKGSVYPNRGGLIYVSAIVYGFHIQVTSLLGLGACENQSTYARLK
jgi:hypothetical protein